MTSYFIYNFYVLFAIIFAYVHERINLFTSRGVKFLSIGCVFCSLFLLSALRFDVGPDYETYVYIYKNIVAGRIDITYDKYFFGYLSTLFSSLDRGYVLVFAVYSFLTLFFVFKVILERKIFLWGIIVFCFVGFYLDSLDRIRQVLAVAIFLYSIKFIEKKEPLRYFIAIIIASFFHLSALMLMPVYFYNRFKFEPLTLIIGLFGLLVLYLSGFTTEIQALIYNNIPYYNEIYGNSQFAHLQGGFGTGLGFVFHIFLIMFSIYNLKDNYILRNLLFTAGLLMIIAPGNLNIMRFGQYFYISLIIALTLAIKSLKKEYSYNLLYKCLFFCLLFIFFQSQQSRNNYSYQSIFSDSFNSELFTPRSSDRTIINH